MTRHIIPFPTRDMQRFFGEELFFQNEFAPSVDIYQDKDNVIAELALPGIDPSKVDVTIENDVLTVSGSTEEKHEVKQEDYYHREIRMGRFSRAVVLPMAVKGSDAKASYAKGVLTITMPKEESVKPKKVTVEIEQ